MDTGNCNSTTQENKALISAVGEGDIDKLTKVLFSTADISVVLPKYGGCHHVNLACIAAIKGHAHIISILKNHGAQLNFFTNEGFNPLHLAAINDHPDVLLTLVSLGIDVNSLTSNKHGATALHISSRLGYLRCTEQLIALGAEVNSMDKNQLTPLMRAAERNRVEIIKSLLSQGADPSATTDAGWEVAHIVARMGSAEALKFLMEKDHNLKETNKHGLTSIDMAIKYEHHQLFEQMLDIKLPKGEDHPTTTLMDLIQSVVEGDSCAVDKTLADGGRNALIVLPEYRQKQNINLISIAAIEGKEDVIRILHGYGAKLNNFSKDGIHALHYAACIGHPKVLNVLGDLNMNLEAATQDEHGWTALHKAAEQGQNSCVEQLIKLGVHLNTRDNYQRTPFILAAEKNKVECMKLLYATGKVDASATDNYGMGAAHHAAKEGSYGALRFLMLEGLDIHKQDGDGYTPLDWAELSGHRDVAEWLAKVERPPEAPPQARQNTQQLLIDSKNNYETWGQSMKNHIHYGSLHDTSNMKDGHYQDENGWTLLHHAADTNNETIARFLLDSNLVATNVIAYDKSTPADVAKRKGHKILAKMLKEYRKRDYDTVERMAQQLLDVHDMKHGKIQGKNQHDSIHKLVYHIKKSIRENQKVEDKDLYLLLLHKINEGDNIEDIVKLLNLGCPVSPIENVHVHALKLAIDLDRPKITTALLAVGTDIFFRSHEHDLLKYIWKSSETTIFLKMIISRMYEHRVTLEGEKKELRYKKDLDKILKGIIKSIKENPEKKMDLEKFLDKDSDDKTKKIEFNSKKLTALLYEAVDANCPFLVSFLHNAGACVYTLVNKEKNTIHHTLDVKTGMEEMLLTHLGGSLYVKDNKGRMPADIMHKDTKKKMERKMAISEFTKLENALSSAKDIEYKSKIKKFTILFACLYASNGNSQDTISWQELYSYMILKPDVVENASLEDEDFYKKCDRLTWVHQLCEKKTHGHEYSESLDHHEYERASLSELIGCLNHLKKKITKLTKDKYKIQLENEEKKFSLINCNDILKEALQYTCKKRFDLFLHLLICHAGINPESHLDDMLKTQPLHHAATEGNQSAVAYLIHTCNVKREAVDLNGNNAAHYAYMHGRIVTGDYIIESSKHNLIGMMNSSGCSPRHLLNAFKSRVKKLNHLPGKEEIFKNELEEKMKIVSEQSDEIELTKMHMHLSMLRRKIKRTTFKELALGHLVDYSDGENKDIYNEVVNLLREVGKKIGKKNKKFQGELIPAGSAADGTRLGDPEESDFNWVLYWEDVIAKLEELLPDQKAWEGFSNKIVLDSDNPEHKELLSGSNLINKFYFAVKEAISELLNFSDKRLTMILPGVKRTGVGVSITLAWMGKDHKLLLLDVDLVPVIKIARPLGYIHPPLTQHLSGSTQSLKHTIDIAGQKWEFTAEYLHAAFINNIVGGSWRFSQTLEENYIMLNLSKDQQIVFIICKYLVSILKSEPWYPEKIKKCFWYFKSRFFKLPAPQGFLLKSSFFRELQRLPEDSNWQEQYHIDRLKCIFLHMCQQNKYRDALLESLVPGKNVKVEAGILDSGKVPSYFAHDTQRQTAGLVAPIIFEMLNTMDITGLQIRDEVEYL